VKNFDEFGPLFWEHKFLIADISDTSCRITTKFGMVMGLNLVYFDSGVRRCHVVTCIGLSLMHLFIPVF